MDTYHFEEIVCQRRSIKVDDDGYAYAGAPIKYVFILWGTILTQLPFYKIVLVTLRLKNFTTPIVVFFTLCKKQNNR